MRSADQRGRADADHPAFGRKELRISEIQEQLGAFPSTISRRKQRYEKDGLLGLARTHPGRAQKLTPRLRAKVLEKARKAPPYGPLTGAKWLPS